MSARTCLAIVLAAGEGTRMLSSQPKALHAAGIAQRRQYVGQQRLARHSMKRRSWSGPIMTPSRLKPVHNFQRRRSSCNGNGSAPRTPYSRPSLRLRTALTIFW